MSAPAPRRPPSLHVLVTPAAAARPDLEAVLDRMRARCGAALALHLRLPEASGRELHRLARRLVAGASRHGGWVVVNERLDVALAAEAHAVQLGSGALPVRAAAGVAAGRLAIGASVHGPGEAARAARDGANYLILGTIFATPSHPDVEPGGLERIGACRDAGLPIVAIGGIDADRVPEVVHAGASGIAVVRAVWSADAPDEAAAALARALETSEPV